jgi:hypothetical protein
VNLPLILAAILILTVALAWARLLLWQYRAPPGARSSLLRMIGLLALQPVCAALLYLTLLPPERASGAETLIVATANAPQPAAIALGQRLIALPEAPQLGDAERMPDLGTALRRYPGTGQLRVIGEGLAARDRDAARALPITFDPLPLRPGIIRLGLPAEVAPGAAFQVGGQVHGIRGGSAELIDPAGARTDIARLPASGEFVLNGSARVAGTALFRLRVRDARRALVEEADVPLVTAEERQPRILLIAGAPGPEIKYLRRWATDAGLSLHAQLSVGGGVQLGDAPLPLNSGTLQRFDLAVLDERSWAELAPGQRSALVDAVRGGLGLLLRPTGPLPDDVRRQWRGLGFDLSSGAEVVAVRLDPASTTPPEEGEPAPSPGANPLAELSRRELKVAASDAVPMLRDASGATLASWRAEGRGRVAVWTLANSFGLVLTGEDDRYGRLWSEAFATLARAETQAPVRIDPLPAASERMSLCGVAAAATVTSPEAELTRLLVDPATGSAACAAFWPAAPGWHLLRTGARSIPFFVHPAAALPALRQAERAAETGKLAAVQAKAAPAPLPHRGPSWPWFLAWLAASAFLWWLERARRKAGARLESGTDQASGPLNA